MCQKGHHLHSGGWRSQNYYIELGLSLLPTKMDKDRARRRRIDCRSPCTCSLRPNSLSWDRSSCSCHLAWQALHGRPEENFFAGIIALRHSCRISGRYIKQPRDSINTCGARRWLELRYCARDMDLVKHSSSYAGRKESRHCSYSQRRVSQISNICCAQQTGMYMHRLEATILLFYRTQM
jgi:hypothetical protein